jgi:hypothetical protein
VVSGGKYNILARSLCFAIPAIGTVTCARSG